MSQRAAAHIVRFEAKPYEIDGSTILRLPAKASEKLPSRGQVAVEGKLNDRNFETVVEPDGAGGHWIRIPDELLRPARVQAGHTMTVELASTKDWPEPDVPQDLAAALSKAPLKVRFVWDDITPMARWEWVRWVNATNNVDTRKRRVEVSLSKMSSGKRRPCCFNLASCTDPQLARGGRLRGPD